jgi:pSer/pThr/pTyr-binding forkhead associated (FHA) protein
MKISLKTPCSWDGVAEIVVDHFPFVLGRDEDADCALNFAFVSRQHCQFTMQDVHVLIQDLESHNGTYLNGRRVSQPTPVQDGDEVSVGPLCFRVTLVKPAAETIPEFRVGATFPVL